MNGAATFFLEVAPRPGPCHNPAVTHLLLLVACPGTAEESKDDEAWPEWAGPSDTAGDGAGSSADTDSAPEAEYDACEPTACIELAEATDRGFATISFGMYYLKITNTGPYPVCFEDWYIFTSENSQDALAGVPGSQEIPPSDFLPLPYGVYGTAVDTWWCIEEDQLTTMGGDYDYDGARAPDRLFAYANDRTDADGDVREDHTDYEGDGLARTQHNVWDYVDSDVVFIVGREMNWFDVSETRSATVGVRVTNIGREAGTAYVTETLPPGWTPSAVSPEPVRTVDNGDGSGTLVWQVSLDAARDPRSSSDSAEYDVAVLSYTLAYEGKCQGREVGNAPGVRWNGVNGQSHDAEGSPLVLECCAPDDEFTGPDGVGP